MSDEEHEASDDLDVLVAEIAGGVRAELNAGPEDSDLQLTGLEGIVLALALKTAVGVLSGFLGRAAFERWRAARTRKQLRDVAVMLDLSDAPTVPRVDQREIEHELMTQLMDQGLTAPQAQRIVAKAMEATRARILRRTGPLAEG